MCAEIMPFDFAKYKQVIDALCHKHKVKNLFLFGSALSDTFKDNSDIDMVVDFKDVALEKYADNYYELKFSLENLLKRKVDLLEEQAIKNPYFKKEILSKRRLIYG